MNDRKVFSHGTATRWKQGCRCPRCSVAGRASVKHDKTVRELARLRELDEFSAMLAAAIGRWDEIHRPTAATFTGPMRPVLARGSLLHCGCGMVFMAPADLVRHTVQAHRRPPTKAERTPQRRQEAA